MEKCKNAEEMVIRAKFQLYKNRPFYGYLLGYMKCREDKNMPMHTMGIDINGNLFYDSAFVESLTGHELYAVLCHEVLHIALSHLYRVGKRNHCLFNIANDLKVNDMLITEGMTLPKEGVIPTNHSWCFERIVISKIDEKTSEQIYEELYTQIPKVDVTICKQLEELDNQRIDSHHYADTKGKDGKKMSEETIEKAKESWKKAVASAAIIAKQRGLMSAGISREIDELLDSKISWRHKIEKCIANSIMSDYTWNRPSKRSLSTGVYMPSTIKESVELVFSGDISGSISKEEMTQCVSEVAAIVKSFANIDITLLYCDAAIHNVYHITRNDDTDMLNFPIGGGGTSHMPIVEWINENKPSCKLLIAFTDGCSDIEEAFKKLPDTCHKIILLTEKGRKVEDMEMYGEVIKYEAD